MSDDIQVENGHVSVSVPVSETVEASWKDSLSDDLKSEAGLQDFKDINGLAKSYLSAQSMLGNSIRIPSEDASDEAKQEFFEKISQVGNITRLPNPEDKASIDAFYNKLGRPEDKDGYKLDIPENVELDENSLSSFKELAHSIGLTNEQASKLAAFEASRYQAHEASMQESRVSAEEALKQEWGNDFNNRLQGAKEMIKVYSDKFPEATKELVNGPAGNNPAVLAMLSELYSSLKESGADLPSSSSINYGISPGEAKAQIDDIMQNNKHAYFNDADPGHKEAVEKMSRLFNAAYPDS